MEIDLKVLHVSCSKVYKYKSLIFTHHDYLGPEILRHKDHESARRKVSLRQWGEFCQWFKLNDKERERYRLN